MISRRSLVRTIARLTIGGTVLLGQGGTAAAGNDDLSRRTDDSPADGEPTTLTVTANRSAIRAATGPTTLAPPVADLEGQLDAVSLEDVTAVDGTASIVAGEVVCGTAVADGSIAADAVRSELETRGFVAVGSRNGIERYVSDTVAVGVTESTVIVGYAPTATANPEPKVYHASARSKANADGDVSMSANANSDTALARVDAVLTGRRLPAMRQATRHREASAVCESIRDGDAVGTATLDAETRTRLGTTFKDQSGPIDAVLEATDAIGTALSVRVDGRTDVTVELVDESAGLSLESVRAVLDEAKTDSNGIDVDSVDRTEQGRSIVVDTTVPTRQLFQTPLAAIGVTLPT